MQRGKYSVEEIEKVFKEICIQISEGKSINKILKDEKMPAPETFYDWLTNEELAKRYARATSQRADMMFEEIAEISDHTSEDHTPFTGANVVQRDKLRVDARKWMLAKMNPKKYGEKIDVTTDGKLDMTIDFTQ